MTKWFAALAVLLIALIGVLLWKSDTSFRDEVDTTEVPAGREGAPVAPEQTTEAQLPSEREAIEGRADGVVGEAERDQLVADGNGGDARPGSGPGSVVDTREAVAPEPEPSPEVSPPEVTPEERTEEALDDARTGRSMTDEAAVPEEGETVDEVDADSEAEEAAEPEEDTQMADAMGDDDELLPSTMEVPGQKKVVEPLPYTWLDQVQQASPGFVRPDSQFFRDPAGDPILHDPTPTGPGAGFYDPENPFSEAAERLKNAK